jgi:hypothetical protein
MASTCEEIRLRVYHLATEVAVCLYWFLLMMIVITVVVAPAAFTWALAQDMWALLRR